MTKDKRGEITMKISKNLKKIYNVATFITILSFITTSAAFALPEGATVQAGNAIITSSGGSTLNINQMSEQAIIDWIRFCIARGEIVNFIQPGSNSIALNRVTGGSISEIFGALNANGKVWLINPSGIIFGPSAKINAAGFLASTLDITNKDFLDKAYVFTKSPGSNGYIINKGRIVAENGGYVTLLGEAVKNEGLIQAKLGKVILASGEKMALELDSNGIISVVIHEQISEVVKDADGNDIENAALNTGEITADGGTIILTADVLKDIFENAVNNEGMMRANSLVINEGEVYLLAKGEDARASNTGTIDVSASESGVNGGFVEISGDRIGVGGDIDVSSIDGESGTLLLDPVNLYIIDGGLLDDYSFLDSTVGELWLENFNGNLTMQANNNVYFLLSSDNVLNLQNLPTETFRVKAGNDINLNDDSIVTQRGNVELIADADTSGTGDVLLGISGYSTSIIKGIVTNGGDVTLSGANVNVSSPVNTGGGDLNVTATNDVTHGAMGDVTTEGGSFTGNAGNDYNFRNDATFDGIFTSTGGNVIFGSPDTQTEYTFDWYYISGSRQYYFKEFGYYYDDGGLVKRVPLAKSFDIGKDGTPLLSGAGIIYGEDFVGLELYTEFEWGGVQYGPYYQDPTLNIGGLDHVQIEGTKYQWEDLIDLGGQARPEPDYNDAVINFIYNRYEYPPEPTPTPTPTVVHQAPLWWDLRFKIPKKHLTDLLQVTYTNGPIELLAEQIYFYHPLIEMDMYEMPALGMEFYEFIDGNINITNPALLPVILEEK
ncbi:MAG: filamentous hemagglutinin N-terminal domain-containing protein [Candidatus Omnitrophica bacterium]|nr:filamentous hemagglutinin N-terminal domain-containing protein [Candidatus Omnitrophota bacterium]